MNRFNIAEVKFDEDEDRYIAIIKDINKILPVEKYLDSIYNYDYETDKYIIIEFNYPQNGFTGI